MTDDFERFIAAKRDGLYESMYLKANSPDGRRGLWVKHNLLRPRFGAAIAETWLILFERDAAPIVAKQEHPWTLGRYDAEAVRFEVPGVTLAPELAEGRLADLRWRLALSGGGAPLFHLPHAWLYRVPFPKKKLLTPAPRLRFDGEIEVGARRWAVDGWVGLRGHNWGTEHAHAYAYGNCQVWDDGAEDRVVDGFSASVKLGGRPSPWLSAVVGRGPNWARNRIRDWRSACELTDRAWSVRWADGALSMRADPATYAGLRYAHPDGRESACYNTKFADVRWETPRGVHTSRQGELEVLFPQPLPGIPLHPAAGWRATDGAYRSVG